MNAKQREEVPLIPLDSVDDFAWIRLPSSNGLPCSIGCVWAAQAAPQTHEAHCRGDVYTVVVHLAGCPGHELWCDERPMQLPLPDAGMLSIYGRGYHWKIRALHRCDCIVFHFPAQALSRASEEGGPWEFDMQAEPVRCGLRDHVMHHLALALLPAFSNPLAGDAKYVKPLLHAAMAHLARAYGRAPTDCAAKCARLAPWQVRRVKELIAAKLDDRVGVSDLADVCRLSASHFTLLFKQTVGTTPHQWLLDQRIERAKELLRTSGRSLTEIAYATGFADQSHFARVFAQRVRTRPQAWRRQFREKKRDDPSQMADSPAWWY